MSLICIADFADSLLYNTLIFLYGVYLTLLDIGENLAVISFSNQVKPAKEKFAIDGAGNILAGGGALGDDLSFLIDYLVKGLAVLEGGCGEFVGVHIAWC